MPDQLTAAGNAERVLPVPETLLPVPETLRRTGLKRSTMYEMIRDEKFPRPVRLTPRCTAFVESEVAQWIADRIASRAEQKAA